MKAPDPAHDIFNELRFALAEADAEAPDGALQDRIIAGALARRTPGRPVLPPSRVSGLDVFERTASSLGDLLADLEEDEWQQETVRQLTVQELVGHLIGVEDGFAAALMGDGSASDADHVMVTQAAAREQRDVLAAETSRRWTAAVDRTLEVAGAQHGASDVVRFHRLAFPLDALLVVRAFEIWTHKEDIERATARPRADPEAEVLARMTDLATALLPAGIARAGSTLDVSLRLVLSGPGGGTWDVPAGSGPAGSGSAGSGAAGSSGVRLAGERSGAVPETLMVVDAAAFCRAVANRADRISADAVTVGDPGAVASLFAGAAALALD